MTLGRSDIQSFAVMTRKNFRIIFFISRSFLLLSLVFNIIDYILHLLLIKIDNLIVDQSHFLGPELTFVF